MLRLTALITFLMIQPALFAVELKTDAQKYSYTIGNKIAHKILSTDANFNADAFIAGFSDAMQKNEAAITEADMNQALATHQQKIKRLQAEAKNKVKEMGNAFLAENKKKEGVVTLDSGLQYKIIQAGTGVKPKATDSVKVHYRGTLISGKQFDSSYDRGNPAVFGVNRVIKGWTEALQLMPEGSQWKLFIPSTLAYGARSQGRIIRANETLIFDVELITVNPK